MSGRYSSSFGRSNAYNRVYSNGNNSAVEEDEPPRIGIGKVTINGNSRRGGDATVTRIVGTTRRNEGVQVKETDVGQPCAECNNCSEGYEPHSWRKNCKNCKCLRDGHEVVVEHGARARLGLNATHDGIDARTMGYTFVPSGLTARQVDQYYSSMPAQDVPKLGSRGENARLQRIVRQLPKQDLSISACKFIEESARSSYQDFISARNEIALDIAVGKPVPPNTACDLCHCAIPSQQVAVFAPRMGSLYWHPLCFRCTKCQDLLVDLAYCVYNEEIYCERHYAELLKPRCEGCDEVIKFNYSEINRDGLA